MSIDTIPVDSDYIHFLPEFFVFNFILQRLQIGNDIKRI